MSASALPVSVRGRTFVRSLDEGVIYRDRTGQLVLCTSEAWEDWCGERGVSVPMAGSHFTTKRGVEVFVRGSNVAGVRVVMGRERVIPWKRWTELSRAAVPSALDLELAQADEASR